MIYELLSTALLAVSMGSLKPDTPKKAFGTPSSINGSISIGVLDNSSFRPDISFALNGYSTGLVSANDLGNQRYGIGDGNDEYYKNTWDYSRLGSASQVSGTLLLYISEQSLFDLIFEEPYTYFTFTDNAEADDIFDGGYDGRNHILHIDWIAPIPQEKQSYSFNININVPAVETYEVTETRNNCSRIYGEGYNQLPATYKTTNNPYKIGFACNDGYYFKTDGSGITATGGIEILSTDYGNFPTISHLVYSTQVTITLNLPLANCSLTLNPVTLSVQEVNDLYSKGFDDAKAVYGENIQFNWIKSAFDGMAAFFNIQVLPNISLGFLCFAPVVVVAIVAIVRIIKHE